MQPPYLFEYAVLRIVPRVEREEFLNAGVVLYCAKPIFLGTRYHIDQERIRLFCGEVDIRQVEENLLAFKKISEGAPGSGPISRLDPASRFRWLTATRSTILQSSKVHPGFCEDPAATLQRLFEQLVL